MRKPKLTFNYIQIGSTLIIGDTETGNLLPELQPTEMAFPPARLVFLLDEEILFGRVCPASFVFLDDLDAHRFGVLAVSVDVRYGFREEFGGIFRSVFGGVSGFRQPAFLCIDLIDIPARV